MPGNKRDFPRPNAMLEYVTNRGRLCMYVKRTAGWKRKGAMTANK